LGRGRGGEMETARSEMKGKEMEVKGKAA